MRQFFTFKSIRFRILFFGIAAILFAFLFVFAILGWEEYTSIRKRIQRDINLFTSRVAQTINWINLESSTFPKIMAAAQQTGGFGDREASTLFARRVLELNPQLTGAYFGYEPNADQKDEEYRAIKDNPETAGTDLAKSVEADGRFLPYWHRDKEDPSKILVEPLVLMETSLYYQGNKNCFLQVPEFLGISLTNYNQVSETERLVNTDSPRFEDVFSTRTELNRLRPTSTDPAAYNRDNTGRRNSKQQIMITEPYVYQGKLIYELTYPIVIDGKFHGIAGVDQALTDVQTFLKSDELKYYDTAGYTLISRAGRIIASTHHSDEITSRPLQNIPIPSLRDVLEALYHPFVTADQNENQTLLESTDPTEELDYIYAAAKINTGDWTLVMRVSKQEVYSPLYRKMTYLCIIFGIGLILVIVALSWLTKSVVHRITLAAKSAEQIARGDLTGKVQVVGQDESGQLLLSITTMTNNLNTLIGEVKKSSIALTSTATKISGNAKTQEIAVNDFGSSTTEIAAAVKEISATSQELSKTMNNVTTHATETANLADSGREGLAGMETAMDTLSKANSSISSKLSVISERAKNINRVVTTISKVADQTNLLSLNAAIEAEKAGEYGLGFSVVAREVRRLADQTAVATLDIDRMVKEMQSSVSAGVMEMDKFTEHMREGNENVRNISSQLGLIIQHVQELTEQFETVRQGMDTQATGAHQINSAMVHLTEAARSTSTSITAFKQATDELHNAVGGLRKEVTKFKVDQQ